MLTLKAFSNSCATLNRIYNRKLGSQLSASTLTEQVCGRRFNNLTRAAKLDSVPWDSLREYMVGLGVHGSSRSRG